MANIDPLSLPLHLPCGATLANRIAKAAMSEGLADPQLRATDGHARLYRAWSEGGAGLLLTGNVMIDRRVLERPGNVAIDPAQTDPEAMARLKAWANAGTANGNHLWMQISHAGRQSPRYVASEPLAPSAVQLDMANNYAVPRAMREDEILDFINRFAMVARTAREAGFTGVQVHGAHGYLLSSFLSPVTNRRTDAWGGSLANRARFLLEAIKATRAAVGSDFPVAVKLNSSDFQKGGFTSEECLQVVEWLNEAGIDLLEISGGSYEQPKLFGLTGSAETAGDVPQRESTRRREGYFLEYAAAIRKVAAMPVMVTGGFRTHSGMIDALEDDAIDVIGLARPLVTDPNLPKRLLSGEVSVLPSLERSMHLGTGRFGPTATNEAVKLINMIGQQGWYCLEIQRRAEGLKPAFGRGVLGAAVRYMAQENFAAWRMRRARNETT